MLRVIKAAVAILSLGSGAALAADGSAIGLAEAKAMAERAEKAALARGIKVSIVIANREGRVIVAHRMDDTPFTSLDVAQGKAVAAGSLGVPSALIQKAVDGGMPSLLSVNGLTAIAGGLPMVRGDRVVAGIGVSGGSPDDDESIARAGLGLSPAQSK